eukprot:1160617-Pelagomonas_calceolata.AAC.11
MSLTQPSPATGCGLLSLRLHTRYLAPELPERPHLLRGVGFSAPDFTLRGMQQDPGKDVEGSVQSMPAAGCKGCSTAGSTGMVQRCVGKCVGHA